MMMMMIKSFKFTYMSKNRLQLNKHNFHVVDWFWCEVIQKLSAFMHLNKFASFMHFSKILKHETSTV